ncbi:MAG: glycine--tRNA ligase subunit beta [Syntrophomonadales bacterium]|jgi:glycyl-tRNA synthetase beta chain
MTRELLFEIGTEEMPALLLPGVIEEFKNLAEAELNTARLSFKTLRIGSTPRRLTLMVEGLPEQQEESVREVRGPKADKAFDSDGNPTKAVQGFVRSQGISVEDLITREAGGHTYVFASIKESGQPTIQVLPEVLSRIITGLPFSRSMRWGYSEIRFIRPIRWILASFDGEVIPIKIENVAAGDVTYGHRFLHPGAIKVSSIEDYMQKLRDAYVLVDVQERRDWIWEQVQKVARDQGGRVIKDADLLEEVNFLVEYPTAFAGTFSADYLSIPSEVLVTSMKEHQRYFPVVDEQGKLLPVFVGVRNGTTDSIQVVAEGNQRVLKARLDDAYFFYREDTKEPLESKVELLKNVIYQARLGTIWEKTERLQKLSAFIARELGFEQIELTERAALLCKADLETSMVYEFPELQGIMGQNYALIDGEDPMVAQAIFEHYLPRFAGDDLPVSPAGTALSLAEKFDNLVGNFAIGVRPTGSQDPYALRRQALGIVAIVLGSNLKLDLHKVISTSYRQFAVSLDLTEEETINAVMDFILLRLRGVLQDEGVSYDVLDAVMNLDTSQLLVISERARALAEIKEQPYFSDLMVAFSRPFNLSRKGGDCKVQPGLFEDQAERELFEVTARLTRELESYLTQGNYFCYCEELAAMRPSLDAFFARIMVMVEDEQIRENRLALLKQVAQLFLAFADFSKLVV